MQHSVLSTQFFDESERLRIQHMEQYPDNKMIRGKQVLRRNLHLPATQQEWLDVQHSCIDVRRAHIHAIGTKYCYGEEGKMVFDRNTLACR